MIENKHDWKIHRRLDEAKRIYIYPARGNDKTFTQLELYRQLLSGGKRPMNKLDEGYDYFLSDKEDDKTKGDVYYLKDRDDGQIGYKFVVEEDDFYLQGKCYEAYSWNLDGTPYEYSYVAGVYCKWDACTHWYFRGEDYETEDEADSYHHLCGGYSFMGHIIAMCFVWKLAEQIISESEHAKTNKLSGYIHDEYFDHERIKQLIELVLNGYEIVKEDRKCEMK